MHVYLNMLFSSVIGTNIIKLFSPCLFTYVIHGYVTTVNVFIKNTSWMIHAKLL